MEELLSRDLTFTVSAPQGDLSGLQRTLDLLKSIQQVLNAVNGGFRGFAPDRLASRSADQFRSQIQGISDPQGNPIKNVVRNLTSDQIIDRLFGGSGLTTFQAQFEALGREFPKAFQGKLFTSIDAAAQVSSRLQAIIQEQETRNAQQLASIFKGSRVNAQVPITPPQLSAPPAPPKEVVPTPVLAAGNLFLNVPPERITVRLGNGNVELTIPTERIAAMQPPVAAQPAAPAAPAPAQPSVQAAAPAKPAPTPPPQKKALREMTHDELVAWVMEAKNPRTSGMRQGQVKKMILERDHSPDGRDELVPFRKKLRDAQDALHKAELARPASADPATPSPAPPQPPKPAVKPGELPLTEGDKAKPGAGKVDLEIPVGRVDAKLGLGQVKLEVPPDRIDAKAGAMPAAQAGQPGIPVASGGATPPAPPKPPVAASAAPAGDSGGSGGGNVFLTPDGLAEPIDPEGSAREVRRRLLQTRKTASTQITEITKELDRVTDTFTLDKTGAVVLDRRVTEVNPVTKLRNELKRGIADATKEANDSVTAGLTGGKVSDLRVRAQSFRVLSDRLNALAEFSRESAENLGQQAQLAELSKAAATASRQARQLSVRADNEEARIRRQAQQQAERTVEQRLQQMARQEKQIAAEEEADQKVLQDRAKLIAQSGQRSQRTRQQNQRIADEEAREAQRMRGAQIAVSEAQRRIAELRAPDSGFRQTRQVTDSGFRMGSNFFQKETVTFEADQGNQKVTRSFQILRRNGQEVAASLQETTRALKATREEMAAAGREFFRNLAHVTAWTVSVGALYGALGTARAAMQSFLNTQYQVARLTVVFGDGTKASRREAAALANDLMMLAAANGRSTEEALQAGIAWSRLGLTRRQASEAVRVSLLAANVAEIDAAAATENLQAIYQSYGLSVRELGGLLGQLNEISNTSNASVGELFTGLSRVASIAAQANIPLEVLNGLLGQTISQTKQSGANIGNALKTIVGRISSPDILKSLQGNFGVQIADAMGQQKPTLDILDALFARYQQLASAERQALLVQLAGNTQLTRAAALLDNYIRAQVLAINTQNALNSAESENQVIRETLISQLRGIGAELERFAFIQGSNGPVAGLNLLARTFRNVIALFNAPGINMAVTGTIGFLGAVIARAAIAKARVDDVSKSNFISRSATRARQIAAVTTEESAGLLRDIGFYLDPRTLPVRGRLARRRINRGIEDIRIGASFLGPSIASGNLRDVADSTRMIAAGAINSTLGAATAILGKWPVYAAGAAAATVAFNTTLEQLGITMNGTEEAINRTSAALQVFAQQEKSAGNTVRVLRLAAESISKAADPKRVSDIVNAISQIPGALSQAQLEALRQNPADAANILRPAIEAQTLRQDEARANALIVSTYALRRAEADLANTRDSGVFSSDQKRIALQAEAARQRETLLRMAEEEVRGQSEDPRMAEAQQERARRVNAVLDARLRILNEIVATTAGDDTLAKLNAQITAQEAFNQGLRQQLETQRTANRESQAAADQANQRYEEENRKLAALTDAADAIGIPAKLVSSALNGQMSTTDRFRAGFGSDAAERFGNVRPLSQESLKLLRELAPQLLQEGSPSGLVSPYIAAPAIMELSRAQAKTTAMAQREARQVAGRSNTDATIDNRLVQSEKEVEDLRRQRDLALRQATIERTQRDTRRDIGGAAFGDNETDKIQRQIQTAQREYEDAQDRLDRSNVTERDQIEQTARASAAVLEIKRLQEEQSRRQVDIEREINQLIIDRTREFQKQILTQSPTELLRTLAALQTASRGLNAGRFFASGDLRERILEIPGFGTDEARLARERSQARRTRERPRDQIDALLEALQTRITQILSPLAAQPVNVGANAGGAAGSVGALATAAELAGTAATALSNKLGALSTAVDALAAKMNGIAIPPNLPIPRGVPGR